MLAAPKRHLLLDRHAVDSLYLLKRRIPLLPEERYAKLSALTSDLHMFNSDLRFQASRLANLIGKAFAEYIGAPVSAAKFYKLSQGTKTPAKNGWDAIIREEDDSWTFGLGIELEMGKGVQPTFVFFWPMSFQIGDTISIKVGLTDRSINIPRAYETLDTVSEELFTGLAEMLKASAENQPIKKSIGFVTLLS